MNETDYLIHYGVLGMKWGVRKKKPTSNNKRSSKTQSQRKKDYEYLKKKADYNKEESKRSLDTIKDLEKNGYKSKRFKDEYGSYSDKEFKEIIGGTKKEAINWLIESYKSDKQNFDESIKQYNDMMKKLKNTPTNQKTFMDKKRRNEKIKNGAVKVGSILGLSGSIALGVMTKSPSVALGTAISTGILGMSGLSSAIPTSDSSVYERYVNKKK